MTKKTINKEKSELVVDVVADKKVWEKHIDKAFKHLVDHLSIKGFRKGQIPESIAKQHISDEDVWTKALGGALDELVKEAAKEIDDKKEFILDGPTYKVNKLSRTELEVSFIYPLYPEIKGLKYKNIGIKYKAPKWDPKVVDDEIQKIESNNSMNIVKKGAITNGDIAKFDFDGYVEDKPFDGGKAENYELEIGSGQFIPGFEEQMIGFKKGDAKDVKVTFPADYHVEKLAGKDAVFKTKIHEVLTKKSSKLDDKGVLALSIPNVKTVAELRAYIEKVFKEQQIEAAKSKFQKDLFAEIKKNLKINIPTVLIVREMEQLKKSFQEELAKSKITSQQYMKMTGMDDVKMDAQYREQAQNRLEDSFIFAEISKLEKIEIKEEDYIEEYKKLAKVYNQDEESIKGLISKSQMQIPMTNTKVLELLIKENK